MSLLRKKGKMNKDKEGITNTNFLLQGGTLRQVLN
jgi:hypothetical protein